MLAKDASRSDSTCGDRFSRAVFLRPASLSYFYLSSLKLTDCKFGCRRFAPPKSEFENGFA